MQAFGYSMWSINTSINISELKLISTGSDFCYAMICVALFMFIFKETIKKCSVKMFLEFQSKTRVDYKFYLSEDEIVGKSQ